MTFESILTSGNITHSHIHITPFRDRLPVDVVGGSTRSKMASKLIRLAYGVLVTDTDIPTDRKNGKPRNIFRDRVFPQCFFEKTGADPGDTVLFEQVSAYHLRLSLRKVDGRIIAP